METACDTAGIGHRAMEVSDLPHNGLYQPDLPAIGGGDGIPMHWISQPDHRMSCGTNCTDERRKPVTDQVGAHPDDEGKAAGLALRVKPLAQGNDLVRADTGADLAGNRVTYSGEHADVSAVRLAGTLTSPGPVR